MTIRTIAAELMARAAIAATDAAVVAAAAAARPFDAVLPGNDCGPVGATNAMALASCIEDPGKAQKMISAPIEAMIDARIDRPSTVRCKAQA